MMLKVGDRLGSTACSTEVIVVRAPAGDVQLTCGNAPMTPAPATAGEQITSDEDGTLVGKRYQDPDSGLELLCTKAGSGALRVGGAVLGIKAAKALPSSD